ncbi:MAG TPA: TIR domain-containing protein [Pyrinomonadaceae bacterium]|nr:TIR domain-containing protein [Pyrinomonadaceae bacterium]
MNDIFISYAREDRGKAEQLARVFVQQGWTVWWDKVLSPGSKYAEVITEQLAGAKAVIVLWSGASVASTWVRDEAGEGAARNALVAALVEHIQPPLGFRQFHACDLSEWDGSADDSNLQEMLRAVAALIDKPHSPPAPSRRPAILSGRFAWLHLLVGVGLVVALSAVFFRQCGARPDPTDNRNDKAFEVQNGAGVCGRDARQRAADLTGKGLTFIDPGGNHSAAVLQFDEAIAECANYVAAYFFRGQSYVALNRQERALEDFRKVVELSPKGEHGREAREFIVNIGGRPADNQSMPSGNANANANRNATGNRNDSGSNANVGPTPTGPPAVGVRDIFATNKPTRIAATTRLILEKKNDPEAVRLAVRAALEQNDNKSGVINTLVYLQNVEPSILKGQRAEIEKLFAVARKNGEQTVEHIKKVEARLNN